MQLALIVGILCVCWKWTKINRTFGLSADVVIDLLRELENNASLLTILTQVLP